MPAAGAATSAGRRGEQQHRQCRPPWSRIEAGAPGEAAGGRRVAVRGEEAN